MPLGHTDLTEQQVQHNQQQQLKKVEGDCLVILMECTRWSWEHIARNKLRRHRIVTEE